MHNIAVYGLWHLGSVTSVCLSSLGFSVTGFDEESVVNELRLGNFPVYEPKLHELYESSILTNRLTFEYDLNKLSNAKILWVCFDTPVDDDDVANIDFVILKIIDAMYFLETGSWIVVSSQVPVGSIGRLKELQAIKYPDKEFYYSSIPENLRLGQAVDIFLNPDRLIVGIDKNTKSTYLIEVLSKINPNIITVSIESAELIKHSINAFLALSITFINEISNIAERVGANAGEVSRGLKSESRIGNKAYLSPGTSYGGGTLARDINYLINISKKIDFKECIFSAIRESNNRHKYWILNTLLNIFKNNLDGIKVGVLGLSYKPGTNSIRRSTSVDLCVKLVSLGANLKIHDPMADFLPAQLGVKCYSSSEINVIGGMDVVILATEWPQYKTISKEIFMENKKIPIIIDPKAFLVQLRGDSRIPYFTIGSINNS